MFLGCEQCLDPDNLGFNFTMAFQPIVDLERSMVFAHEALVRGLEGESAAQILSLVSDENWYAFDQSCRVTAIDWATRVKLPSYLSINFFPNAVYTPENCIRTTLAASMKFGFPTNRIIFEVTEGEEIEDRDHLVGIIEAYKNLGFKTAIDDFGAGYAGLNLLAQFQPDIVKLDRELISNIDSTRAKQAIVRGIIQFCNDLDIQIIAEGIETLDELRTLRSLGIILFQGYLFARPKFQGLPEVDWPDLKS